MATAAAWLSLGSPAETVFLAGYTLLVGAAVLAMPAACALLSSLWRPAVVWVYPVEGRLAIDSLRTASRRTAATVAAVMLSTAMTIGLAGVGGGVVDSIGEWIASAFTADLMVATSENLMARDVHLPATIAADLAEVEGVQTVQSVRTLRIQFDGQPILVIGMEMNRAMQLNRRRPVAGDFAAMHALAGEGRGVIASENLMQLRRLRLGDQVALAAPGGVLRAPIVGVLRDYSSQTGSIYIDLAVLRHYWNDASADLVHVYVAPGADIAAVRTRILERFGQQQRLFVLSNREVREFVLQITQQWFALSRIQVAVAVLVAVLGIGTALTVAIVNRRRELGILRAVGGTRTQVRRALWIEAFLLAAMGWTLGSLFGAINLLVLLEAARRTALAAPIGYVYPATIALTLLPVLLAAAWMASLGPTEAAVRGPLVDALESE